MAKIKSLADLKKRREELQSKNHLRVKSESRDEIVEIKVAMATCGIASGSKEVMDFLIDSLQKRNIESIVTQTGCMGYCYAEPTIEVKVPGKDPVVFGYVDIEKADDIIEKYIKSGELIDGIIPVNYQTIDE